MKHRGFPLLFLLLTLVLPAAAQSADSLSRRDRVHERVHARVQSLVNPDEQFRWTKLILPAGLVTVGAIGVTNEWYNNAVNNRIRDFAAEIRGERYLHFDDYIQYIPLAGYAGLGFAVPKEHPFGDRLLVTASASLTCLVLVQSVKHVVGELRPDESARNSFPSGHTATAMMGAELVRMEYGPWWGLGAYSIATLTALMRIYNNRHWSNDLLGGAAIGIFSAHVGNWLLPVERKLFRINDINRGGLVALPFCSPGYGGLALVARF